VGHRLTGCRSDPLCACSALAKDGADRCKKCLFRARCRQRQRTTGGTGRAEPGDGIPALLRNEDRAAALLVACPHLADG
jgi:hypothetical protein